MIRRNGLLTITALCGIMPAQINADTQPTYRILGIARSDGGRALGAAKVEFYPASPAQLAIFQDWKASLTPAKQAVRAQTQDNGRFQLRVPSAEGALLLTYPTTETPLLGSLRLGPQPTANLDCHPLAHLDLQVPSDIWIVAIAAGYHSGCKLAALDEFGHVLDHALIHVIGDSKRRLAGRQTLVKIIREHQISVIAIGNGNACRQAEQLVADLIATELTDLDLAYTIVNEAGASVYSTSMVGVEELPEFDAELRSAISIGRRLLDPLSELVKISPANIGVGLYQHDLKARNLQESLDAVVAACVNHVSVDVNTASPALLKCVSGLNQLSARSVYEYRCKNGPFRNREQFRDVPSFGDVAYVQAAGFLKINDGDNPLDATLIHPESYEIAGTLIQRFGSQSGHPTASATINEPSPGAMHLTVPMSGFDIADLAAEFGIGEMLLTDILSALTTPRRDPREDLPAPVFRRSIMKLVEQK